MRLEVGGKKLERAFDGRTGHGDEIAKSFAFVEGQNFAELFEDRRATLALLELSSTSASKVLVSMRQAGHWPQDSAVKNSEILNNFFDDALAFADEMHDAAAERRAGFAHGVVVQRRVDLVRRVRTPTTARPA